MARDHAGTVLYRAVITRRSRSGHGTQEEVTDVLGPYLAEGTARAQITRQARWFDIVDSRVEVAHPDWEPVG